MRLLISVKVSTRWVGIERKDWTLVARKTIKPADWLVTRTTPLIRPIKLVHFYCRRQCHRRQVLKSIKPINVGPKLFEHLWSNEELTRCKLMSVTTLSERNHHRKQRVLKSYINKPQVIGTSYVEPITCPYVHTYIYDILSWSINIYDRILTMCWSKGIS